MFEWLVLVVLALVTFWATARIARRIGRRWGRKWYHYPVCMVLGLLVFALSGGLLHGFLAVEFQDWYRWTVMIVMSLIITSEWSKLDKQQKSLANQSAPDSKG